MAPKKDWRPPMRKRIEYQKFNFTVDGRDYILEVPDAVTTNVIGNNKKRKPELYKKISSLAREKGYDLDNESEEDIPMPRISKEQYADLIREAKIALGEGWTQTEKIYVNNIVRTSGPSYPYASIFPANKSGTVRKKRECKKKKGAPAAGDDPDDCDDDEDDDGDDGDDGDEDKYIGYKGDFGTIIGESEDGEMWVYDSGIAVGKKSLPPITVSSVGQKRDHSDSEEDEEEPARKMPAPEQNPYRTRYTDSMGRISVTYLAVDPQYKERYAMDKYFNKVYYFQDHRKHYNDPLNHRPTQIGYIEGPGIPESGERMDAEVTALDGSTQKAFDIQAGDTVYGGNYIYLLKPANQLVLMTDAIMEMENAKKRKEQAERQAWVNSLTPTTYKGKKIYYEPFDKTSGNYNLWDDTFEEGVFTRVGEYEAESRTNPVFEKNKLHNFTFFYRGYDTDSDASASEKEEQKDDKDDKDDDDDDDAHDDIPRNPTATSTITTDEFNLLREQYKSSRRPPDPPSEPERPAEPELSQALKDAGWSAQWSNTYRKYYFFNKNTGARSWSMPEISTGGKRSKKKVTKRRSNTKKSSRKNTKKSRSSKKTKKSRKGKNTKLVKISLRKIGKKNVRHHYTLDATSKKRHLAIAEGVNMEAKKTNRTRKQAAVAKKARLNVLRMYRKNNNPKQCNIITRDMEHMDRKYGLGKTVNICKKK